MVRQVFAGLFGIENEFAVAAYDEQGVRVPEGVAIQKLFQYLKGLLPFLHAYDNEGIFISNGGRIYLDQEKLEICTPELNHPDDACLYVRAGERTICLAADALIASGEFSAVSISRCKVSYRNKTCHGFHESYSTQLPVPEVIAQLQGHLVSRMIYSGAGGLDCYHPGPKFTLSPRFACLAPRRRQRRRRLDGSFAMERRKLGKGHRLHLASSEGLSSDRALWLLIASTAALVAALHAGATIPHTLRPLSPHLALHTVCADPTLTATLKMESGRDLTALELQHAYLEIVESLQNSPRMPDWTSLLCERWKQMLLQLADVDSASDTVDWIAKKILFQRHLQQQGVSWERFTEPIQNNDTAVSSQAQDPRPLWHPVDRWMDELSRPTEPELPHDPHQEWKLGLRNELCEIDYRLGELSESGLFHSLQAAGAVDHNMFSSQEIEQAIYEPPQKVNRASIRGSIVTEHAESPRRYRAKWSQIRDCEGQRIIDLSDERTAVAQWKEEGIALLPTPSRSNRSQPEPRPSLETLLSEYRQGEFETARNSLATLENQNSANPQLLRRTQAWLKTRQGQPGGKEILDQLQITGQLPLWFINDQLFVHRFGRLKPDVVGMQSWIEQGESVVVERSQRSYTRQIAVYREHQMSFLFASHRPHAAYEGLKRLLESDQQIPHRVRGRAMAMLGTIAYRLDRIPEATRWLSMAEQLQRSIDARTDLYEFTLPWTALLEDGHTAISDRLETAIRENLASANPIGEARSIILMARHCADFSLLEAMRERLDFLLADTPLLAGCSHLQFILDQWEEWQFNWTESDEAEDWHWGV